MTAKIQNISGKVAALSLAISFIAVLSHAPARGQQNANLPPVSPQPPIISPAAPAQLSPAQLQQSAAPFNFQNFNSAPQNAQSPQGTTVSPLYPPFQNAPVAPFGGQALPQPIPETWLCSPTACN